MPAYVYNPNYLAHYGIPHMKWGDRRFQNEDGTLTEAGRQRYLKGDLDEKSKDNASKAIEIERKQIQDREHERLRKSSKKYKELSDKIDAIDKYANTDEDDEAYYERKIRSNDRDELDSKFREKAHQKSIEEITKKYGEQSIKDIQNYNTKKARKYAQVFAAVSVAAVSALTAFTLFSGSKARKQADQATKNFNKRRY